MSIGKLQAIADRAALFCALRQDQLLEVTRELGDHRWDVDLAAGSFAFSSTAEPGDTVTATPHLLASIAPGPRSLMWSWALPQGDQTGITDALRAYGQENEIPELTSPEIHFPEDTGDDIQSWMLGFAHMLGRASVYITGRSPYFTGNVGSSRALLILDDPIPELTLASAFTRLPRILSETPIADHRTGIWEAARLASWQLDWVGEDFAAATITDDSGTASLEFDDHGRITGVQAKLGGSKTPAPVSASDHAGSPAGAHRPTGS